MTRIAIVHDLPAGGARRRLVEQVAGLGPDVIEVCLSTALPVTDDPILIGYRPRAPTARRRLRPVLRYADLAGLLRSWRWAAEAVRAAHPDVVFANPCQFLEAPAGMLSFDRPTLYFCDEPYAQPDDPAVIASRNGATRHLYAPLYEAERRLDRAATLRATALATNSRHTAGLIRRIYGREAEVLPMGVPEMFTPSFPAPEHILSVGSLLADKGHELVITAAALARGNWPVVVVAPHHDPAEEQRLRGIAERSGVRLSVEVGISDAELLERFRHAYATVYLAREEPFGLVSLEAQRSGSPVIVAATGGLPETVVDGVTGWAVPRDAVSAAARLDDLADLDLRTTVCRAAAVHGRDQTWTRAAAALADRLGALASG